MKININDNVQFLKKSEDVKHKDIFEIASEGEWSDSTKFTKDDGTPAKQFSILLKLSNGEIKSTIFGSKQLKLLGRAFGTESADWIGKQVRAWKTASDKAADGYMYMYAPVDWTRDDTGEWVEVDINQVVA